MTKKDVLETIIDDLKQAPNDLEEDCWIWDGPIHTGKGSPLKAVNGDRGHPRRLAWIALNKGQEPKSSIKPMCKNDFCVSPYHAYDAGTTCLKGHKRIQGKDCSKCAQEKHQRTYESKGRGPFGERTHCPHGHPYDEENTYVHPKTGYRFCRACRRISVRKAKAKRNQQSNQ